MSTRFLQPYSFYITSCHYPTLKGEGDTGGEVNKTTARILEDGVVE